ncbi:4'-phosphopantetheinyl transferase family protein [Acidipropionibacterium jensenii]|uniref:4'-phosphopantetheinyl transferase n=1 Tax=Acidipropionibacterium jensenii TaxID=1749 RepID=A0A448NZQ0_9ACTN|nr:4'-phosphopantetheinyl transferase superfamily protein [Acidipropionibacterium jensenii]MDN5976360.1 4'-phosphopantetheinyl transferase superfamily protein [Acidipropionibacterium jensenii]MDN5996635.1 4'-phosphopantetheinyl transferase superfamily protein [Acidipropionibacterium jensenii]MDN6021005.1 4'-phosphopantetheinyl transferase superfamily protein [Acidipropionibacterium jensenii]MDN6440558.1 4'-phosphopantetheinyl transferase superfamily protein [Acidipropionibacterium jensenii]MDN
MNSLALHHASSGLQAVVAWAAVPNAATCREAESRLSGAELGLMRRLHRPQDQHRFVAARLLLADLAARQTGATASAIHLGEVPGGPGRAKPRLSVPGWDASISHDAGMVAAAVSPAPVGVDIQMTSCADRVRRLSEVFTEAELHWLAGHRSREDACLRWTAKEAILKARGTGFWEDPRDARNDSLHARANGVELVSLYPTPGYVLSLALLAPQVPRRPHREPPHP